jgi:Sec-independent protein translocase protein TatA
LRSFGPHRLRGPQDDKGRGLGARRQKLEDGREGNPNAETQSARRKRREEKRREEQNRKEKGTAEKSLMVIPESGNGNIS